MFMLCLHFFYAFVFRSMLVCLDLVSCILVMLHMSCFHLQVCAYWSLGPSCLFGCISPLCGLFGCNHVQEYIFVMLACLPLAFLSFVQLCMLVLLLLALYVPYNMISSPLCVITCFASFCACYACFMVPWAGFFLSFFFFFFVFFCFCFFASLDTCLCVHAYVFVCLLC